jgi:hypothetical protein
MTTRNTDWTATCSCGKRIYPTRKDARRAGKARHVGEHMSVYQCAANNWHIGHINDRRIRGEIER